jgi:hypothetical protein
MVAYSQAFQVLNEEIAGFRRILENPISSIVVQTPLCMVDGVCFEKNVRRLT